MSNSTGGSRNKGNTGEREVAKKLEEWWRQEEENARFVKTPLSGGWSTPQVRQAFKASGDVMTTAESFPFAVEVKRREAWSPKNFVAGFKSPVWGWWLETQHEARELGAEPMLWVRKNAERRRGKGSGGGTLPPIWTVLIRRVYALELGSAIPPPDLYWHASTLSVGVDYGEALPVGYIEHTLLGVHPSVFAFGVVERVGK